MIQTSGCDGTGRSVSVFDFVWNSLWSSGISRQVRVLDKRWVGWCGSRDGLDRGRI